MPGARPGIIVWRFLVSSSLAVVEVDPVDFQQLGQVVGGTLKLAHLGFLQWLTWMPATVAG